MSDMPLAATFAARSPHPGPLPDDIATDKEPSTEHSARGQALWARMRRRAATDAVLILLLTAGASLPAADSHGRLLSGLAVLSIGILLFVIRRSRDVSRLVEAGRWRDEALVGRGLSLAQWHSGMALPQWGSRGTAEPAPAAKAEEHRGIRPGLEVSAPKADAAAAGRPENSDSRGGAG
ncbi:MAG: hypothetical protein KGZ61_12375 [Sandarakinorhabdus sp.]|nr:hypothetical protein [Sandarakinorhabdus sp.]